MNLKQLFKQYGIIVALAVLAGINIYKSSSLYSHPDYPYDARNVYIAGKLWLKGSNPYNDSLIKSEWNTYVATHRTWSKKPPGFPDCGMIYPFWSIPELIVFYILPWELGARELIWLLSWLALLGIAYFAYKSFHSKLSFLTILVLLLAFKSGAVALVLGQPLLISACALLGCWYFYTKDKHTIAGILLGIAALKVTLCIPFILFFLIHKNWKLLMASSILPVLSALVFYAVSKNWYLTEMLSNMGQQMQINYAGPTLTAVNTNLTELGIIGNYFWGINYAKASVFGLTFWAIGTLLLVMAYLRKVITSHHFLTLLIVLNFLSSYHLIYDCILLIFVIPVFAGIPSGRRRWLGFGILAPLFLPINGLFKSVDWIQFHLPITLLALFLYLIYDCYTIHRANTVA